MTSSDKLHFISSRRSPIRHWIDIMTQSPDRLSLGLDLSTQQLKIVAINIASLSIIYEKSVTFETELSQYNTHKGVYSNDSQNEVYAPVEMWIVALDLILEKMVLDGFPFGRVVAISGAGQVFYLFCQ